MSTQEMSTDSRPEHALYRVGNTQDHQYNPRRILFEKLNERGFDIYFSGDAFDGKGEIMSGFYGIYTEGDDVELNSLIDGIEATFEFSILWDVYTGSPLDKSRTDELFPEMYDRFDTTRREIRYETDKELRAKVALELARKTAPALTPEEFAVKVDEVIDQVLSEKSSV